MTTDALKILVVEDNNDDADLLRLALRRTNFVVERADRMSVALARLATTPFDVVLLDLSLPDSRGLETFLKLKPHARHAAVIVLTGLDDEDLGLKTLHEGAQDYLVKGTVGDSLLVRAIRYACERKRSEETMSRYAEELATKNAQLESDLSLARELQNAFLPHDYPTFTCGEKGRGALSFRHRYVPASGVGGDFFDILPLSEDTVGVLICDVMGHGVRAALVTAMLRVLVADRATAAPEPGQMLAQLNKALRSLWKDTDMPMFVSAFYMTVNARTGDALFANAGHPSPFWLRGAPGSVETLWTTHADDAPALGLMDGAEYRTCAVELSTGDRLLFYTDGLFEVDNRDGEPYGQLRLQEAARKSAGLPSDPFLDRLLTEPREFSAAGGFTDDACLLSMDYATLQTAFSTSRG